MSKQNYLLLFVVFLSLKTFAQTKIMGFTTPNAEKQADWEKQFDAQLNPQNLDTWMQYQVMG